MRVALLGKNSDDLLPTLERHGLEAVGCDEEPETIIAYGGDGTLIGAEKDHPGVPKLGLRDIRACERCVDHPDDLVIERLASGEAAVAKLMKLRARVGDDEFVGMNDVALRNAEIFSAVRFDVLINDVAVTDEIIGDGLVGATPFGSSAYFRSITNTTFRQGIGLAFNNCTDFLNHFVLTEEDVIRVRVRRGPAYVTADNHRDIATVDMGDEIVISRSEEEATVVAPDTLRCSRCRYRHSPRRRF